MPMFLSSQEVRSRIARCTTDLSARQIEHDAYIIAGNTAAAAALSPAIDELTTALTALNAELPLEIDRENKLGPRDWSGALI
jgi:hypothetical protein